jgi:hypothetical protein
LREWAIVPWTRENGQTLSIVIFFFFLLLSSFFLSLSIERRGQVGQRGIPQWFGGFRAASMVDTMRDCALSEGQFKA